jgi:hypothetical protein
MKHPPHAHAQFYKDTPTHHGPFRYLKTEGQMRLQYNLFLFMALKSNLSDVRDNLH